VRKLSRAQPTKRSPSPGPGRAGGALGKGRCSRERPACIGAAGIPALPVGAGAGPGSRPFPWEREQDRGPVAFPPAPGRSLTPRWRTARLTDALRPSDVSSQRSAEHPSSKRTSFQVGCGKKGNASLVVVIMRGSLSAAVSSSCVCLLSC